MASFTCLYCGGGMGGMCPVTGTPHHANNMSSHPNNRGRSSSLPSAHHLPQYSPHTTNSNTRQYSPHHPLLYYSSIDQSHGMSPQYYEMMDITLPPLNTNATPIYQYKEAKLSDFTFEVKPGPSAASIRRETLRQQNLYPAENMNNKVSTAIPHSSSPPTSLRELIQGAPTPVEAIAKLKPPGEDQKAKTAVLKIPRPSPDRMTPLIAKIYELAEFQQPKLEIALWSMVKFVFYVAFMGLLTAQVLNDRITSHSFNVYQACSRNMQNDAFNAVKSKADAVTYVSDALVTTFLKGYLTWDGRLQTTPTVFGGLVPLSTIRLRQMRTYPRCSRSDWRNLFSVCHAPLQSSFGASAGEIFKETLPEFSQPNVNVYRTAESLCEFSTLCVDSQSTVSQELRPDVASPGGGYVYEFNLTNAVLRMTNASINNNGVVPDDVIPGIVSDAFSWITAEGWMNEETRSLIVEVLMIFPGLEQPFFVMPTVYFEFPAEGGVRSAFEAVPVILREEPSILELAVISFTTVVAAGYMFRIVYSKVKFDKGCVKCLMFEHRQELEGKSWYKCINLKCTEYFDRRELDNCPICKHPEQDWHHICVIGAVRDINMWQSVVNAILLWVAFVIRLKAREAFLDRKRVIETLGNTAPFIDFRPIQRQMTYSFSIMAINLMLTYLGLFAHLRHFTAFNRFLRLFAFGMANIFMFLLTFAIMFVGFSIAFHLSFGFQNPAFQDLSSAMQQAFRFMLGDIGYPDFSGNEILAACLYVTYSVGVLLTGVNVFVSIVTESYTEAVRIVPDNVVSNSFVLLYRQIMRKVSRRAAAQQDTEEENVKMLKKKGNLDQKTKQAQDLAQEILGEVKGMGLVHHGELEPVSTY
eukprot:PhF_6_TR18886/c0_g1_i3/m.27510